MRTTWIFWAMMFVVFVTPVGVSAVVAYWGPTVLIVGTAIVLVAVSIWGTLVPVPTLAVYALVLVGAIMGTWFRSGLEAVPKVVVGFTLFFWLIYVVLPKSAKRAPAS